MFRGRRREEGLRLRSSQKNEVWQGRCPPDGEKKERSVARCLYTSILYVHTRGSNAKAFEFRLPWRGEEREEKKRGNQRGQER